MTTTNDAPAQASVATWHPLDENGLAELRVNGKRVTTFPSYPAAEEAAQRINAALSPPPTVGAQAPSGSGVESPENLAEYFIQAAIDSAPEPLRRLGEWLAHKLDDDDWKTADRLITGAAVSCASLAAELDQAAGLIKDRNDAIASLASDASPRGEAWKAGQTVKLSVDVGYASPEAPFALAAHPAPATVEMREAMAQYRWRWRDGEWSGWFDTAPPEPWGDIDIETRTLCADPVLANVESALLRLAVALHEKHYSHVTQWRPLEGDVIGLITQIDNMTAALAPATEGRKG